MEVVLAGVAGDRYMVFWGRIMRCGVTGKAKARSALFKRAAAGDVGADAGMKGMETVCLCMTAVGTCDTYNDVSEKGCDH